jgi:hypothetical protein
MKSGKYHFFFHPGGRMEKMGKWDHSTPLGLKNWALKRRFHLQLFG